MPTSDPSHHAPWLASQRRSRARRAEAARRAPPRSAARRARSSSALASLALAGGAARARRRRRAAPPPRRGRDDGGGAARARHPRRRHRRAADAARHPPLPARARPAVDGIAGPQTLAALGPRRGAHRHARATPQRCSRRSRECESGGDPAAVSADGRYRGKYQFSRATWRAHGRRGRPGGRAGGRAGPPRRGALRRARHRALAELRVAARAAPRSWWRARPTAPVKERGASPRGTRRRFSPVWRMGAREASVVELLGHSTDKSTKLAANAPERAPAAHSPVHQRSSRPRPR